MLNSKQIKKVVSLYKNGASTLEIGRMFGLSKDGINYHLRKNNIQLRMPSTYRKRKINEKFFEIIDTEQKAWVLGFILADGSVYSSIKKRRHSFCLDIQLHKKDIDILEKIKFALNAEHKISVSANRQDVARLVIGSKKIFSDLAQYGVVPNKTLKTRFPKHIPDNLVNHFIRGYFDGDGSINMYLRKNRATYQFNIVGCRELLVKIIKIFEKMIGINLNIHNVSGKNGKKIIGITTCGGHKNIKKIREYLYRNATIYSSRKYRIFNELL